MIEALIQLVPLLGALLGVVIWVLLPSHWKGLLIIAAIVLTMAAVMYNIVGAMS